MRRSLFVAGAIALLLFLPGVVVKRGPASDSKREVVRWYHNTDPLTGDRCVRIDTTATSLCTQAGTQYGQVFVVSEGLGLQTLQCYVDTSSGATGTQTIVYNVLFSDDDTVREQSVCTLTITPSGATPDAAFVQDCGGEHSANITGMFWVHLQQNAHADFTDLEVVCSAVFG